MKKIYTIEELTQEPPSIQMLGGLKNLLHRAISNQFDIQQARGEIFEKALKLGEDHGFELGNTRGFKLGFDLGQSEGFVQGATEFMVEGDKYVVVTQDQEKPQVFRSISDINESENFGPKFRKLIVNKMIGHDFQSSSYHKNFKEHHGDPLQAELNKVVNPILKSNEVLNQDISKLEKTLKESQNLVDQFKPVVHEVLNSKKKLLLTDISSMNQQLKNQPSLDEIKTKMSSAPEIDKKQLEAKFDYVSNVIKDLEISQHNLNEINRIEKLTPNNFFDQFSRLMSTKFNDNSYNDQILEAQNSLKTIADTQRKITTASEHIDVNNKAIKAAHEKYDPQIQTKLSEYQKTYDKEYVNALAKMADINSLNSYLKKLKITPTTTPVLLTDEFNLYNTETIRKMISEQKNPVESITDWRTIPVEKKSQHIKDYIFKPKFHETVQESFQPQWQNEVIDMMTKYQIPEQFTPFKKPEPLQVQIQKIASVPKFDLNQPCIPEMVNTTDPVKEYTKKLHIEQASPTRQNQSAGSKTLRHTSSKSKTPKKKS